MSGGMGYYDGGMFDNDDADGFDPQQVQAQQQQSQSKNPLRDHLKKVEEQNAELKGLVDKLMAQQRRNAVAETLRAKGYDPAVASLYGGEPEKLDEWLTNVGPLLAKQPTDTSGQGGAQQQGGAPASTVPAEGQAALQQFQQAGNQAAGPAGSEAEAIAQMRNAQSPEALMQFLQSQGNQFNWNG